jgi:hypothetical protein
MNTRRIFDQLRGGSFCFYCSVDSEELKTFLIVVIGGLVAASAFVAIGAWLKGAFANVEDPALKEKVLKLEGEDHVGP